LTLTEKKTKEPLSDLEGKRGARQGEGLRQMAKKTTEVFLRGSFPEVKGLVGQEKKGETKGRGGGIDKGFGRRP